MFTIEIIISIILSKVKSFNRRIKNKIKGGRYSEIAILKELKNKGKSVAKIEKL